MLAPSVTRVLILNSARRWIGEAAHALFLAQGLRRRGVEVTLGVRRGHELEARARAAGLQVEAFHFHSRFSPLGDLADLRRLRALVRRTGCQVVSCHRGKDHWLAALALRGLHPRPALVRTRHVVTPMRRHLCNRWLLRRATDRLIAVSDCARQSLAGVLSPTELARVPVLLAAVDLQLFHPSRRSATLRREVLGLAEGECAVGLVGRIQRVKGQRVFLRAAARVARDREGIRFVIAGHERTPGRIDALRREAARLGIAERTVFLGAVEDVAALLASLDVGVVASIGSEGSSRVAYEILASGIPLVATRVGVLPEVIRDGENGLLCPPGDAEALAARIERLLGDAALRERLGRGGRRHVEVHHDPERWLDALQRLYDEVAAERDVPVAPGTTPNL